jgi:hypothetical protein
MAALGHGRGWPWSPTVGDRGGAPGVPDGTRSLGRRVLLSPTNAVDGEALQTRVAAPRNPTATEEELAILVGPVLGLEATEAHPLMALSPVETPGGSLGPCRVARPSLRLLAWWRPPGPNRGELSGSGYPGAAETLS